MKKTIFLWAIIDLMFLVIFNCVFFILRGFVHSASVWLCYAFIHFAYIMLLLTPFFIRGGKSRPVFGFSLYSISSVYFLIEFVIGTIFILNNFFSFNIVFFIQLCIAGFYIVILISNMIANEHTAGAEEKRERQIEYVKQVSSILKSILEDISDKNIKREIEKVYDEINSSPVKSYPMVEKVESQIMLSVNELANAVLSGDLNVITPIVDSLLKLIRERNMKLRLNN